jgi:hypothetical protein
MSFKKCFSAFALMLASAVVSAAPITFMSGTDDGCNYTSGCLLGDQVARTYVNPDNYTELSGASWVQPTGTWNQAGVEYRVWELDLNRPNQDMKIESLFVAFDDDLEIRSKGKLLASIGRYDVPNGSPWNQVINVFDYVSQDILVAEGGRLNFWVTNSGNGPTGLVYKGTASAVSEPATLALLGLGLAGLGFARRRKA